MQTKTTTFWSVALAVLVTGVAVRAQTGPIYSVDFQGPLMGLPDGFGSGLQIGEGDLLYTPAPMPFAPIPPGVSHAIRPNPFGVVDLGIPSPYFPPAPGVASGLELDAVSFGQDKFISGTPTFPEVISFSVDEFAAGNPAAPAPPNVNSEGSTGNLEASGDIFVYFPPIPLGAIVPAGPFIMPPGNTQLFDGDGAPPPGLPVIPLLPAGAIPHGLGVIEPNPPTPVAVPDPGDNVDAFDVDSPGAGKYPVYFSLDAAFPDPLEAPFANTASAAAWGYVGGDVLVSTGVGGPVAIYAKAALLGLDLFGPDTDDLDALVLAENGVVGYQPSTNPFPPFDWGPAGADMLLFSVRRGSAIIFTPDSCLGIPIEEGDVLVPPPAGPGNPPCILIAAENLGLATVRSGIAGPFGADELDALDLSPDCDANLVPDALDIAYGTLLDSDGDTIPDPCDVCPGFDDRIDSDGDTVPDGCDVCPGFNDLVDSDGDSVPDGCDVCPGFNDLIDSDGDTVPDGCDVCPGFNDLLDSDGDTVPDGCDVCPGFNDLVDSDGDTVPDGCDICPGFNDLVDSDGDTVPDGCDVCPGFNDLLDSDGDTVPDGCDVCPGFNDLIDSDGDTVPDGCDICPGFNDLVDSDGDTVPDGCDICPGFNDLLDSDGDTVPDGCDVCPGFNDLLDSDGDTVPDGCDVCPGFDDRLDCDGNGIPDGCEPDLNGNGIPDVCEMMAPAFSIDFQSASKGTPDVSGLLMTEGDIMIPAALVPRPGPLAPPKVLITAGTPSVGPDLGLPAYPGALGIPGGFPGRVEVDALSFGRDALVDSAIWPQFRWTFSVDEHAAGMPGIIPDVNSEGALGNVEASADIFVDFPPGAMPVPPLMIGCPIPPPVLANTHLFDGNGLPAPFAPVLPPLGFGPVPHGLGLIEPNPPTPGTTVDPGDNLDAMDVDYDGLVYPVYFSVDTVFADPIEGPPANSGTDTTVGMTGADVLVTKTAGGVPTVFAPAVTLGLDLVGGPMTDDLDALILHDNGNGTFDPSTSFFDWVGGATDMLLFSVRRGSAVIGMPDSLSGCPIEEGDILTTPVAGGVSPFPAIFIPAESLGLLTARSAGVLPAPLFLPNGEELDALDVSPDCNMNGSPDRFDILYGIDPDLNGDGIPDSCAPPCVIANPPSPEPSPVKKSRYISFIPTNAGQKTALRVELVSLDGFGAFNGQTRWVGAPHAYPEENSAFPGLKFQGARLNCSPFYKDWATVGLLHVFSGDLVPNSRYRVQAITQGCDETNPANYSTALTVTTGKWGDVVAAFAGSGTVQPDFNDIAAEVQKFLADPFAPIKAQAQLQPNTPDPTVAIDFRDISADVDAFLGVTYPTIVWPTTATGPCTCPSTVVCGATACMADIQCPGGLCRGGFCVDACGRCK